MKRSDIQFTVQLCHALAIVILLHQSLLPRLRDICEYVLCVTFARVLIIQGVVIGISSCKGNMVTGLEAGLGLFLIFCCYLVVEM